MAVAASRLCCLSYQPVLAAVSRAIVSESPTSVLSDKMRSATMLSWPLDSALICFSGIGESLAKPLNLQITFICRTTPPLRGKCFQLKSEKRNKSMFLFPF